MSILKRIFQTFLLFGLGNLAVCQGQICMSTHTTNLYCLLPTAFHTSSAPFSAFYTPFGTELSQLPTAKPAGLVLTFEHGQLVPANETLGAIYSERAETIGRHRFFVAFTYQHFGFSSIDGTDLKHLPIVLTVPDNGGTDYTVTHNRLDIKAEQYTMLMATGLTKSIDLSVAIPFERISMSAAVNGTEYSPNGAKASFIEYTPGSSSGIADIVVGAKWRAVDGEKLRLAPGVDIRLPTGDELNFLGSGTVGVKPYLALSLKAHISPHINVDYQWNGDSVLNPNSQGAHQRLPTDFFYTAGVNADVTKRLTLIGDLLGQHFFDAPRLTSPRTFFVPNHGNELTVYKKVGGYSVYNIAIGFKARTLAHLILTGNATIKLNDGGLRSKVAPLVGLSYSF